MIFLGNGYKNDAEPASTTVTAFLPEPSKSAILNTDPSKMYLRQTPANPIPLLVRLSTKLEPTWPSETRRAIYMHYYYKYTETVTIMKA